MSLYCKPSARPRETSSRSTNINISRTTGILSHRTFKIKCYDWLSPGTLRSEQPAQDILGALSGTETSRHGTPRNYGYRKVVTIEAFRACNHVTTHRTR